MQSGNFLQCRKHYRFRIFLNLVSRQYLVGLNQNHCCKQCHSFVKIKVILICKIICPFSNNIWITHQPLERWITRRNTLLLVMKGLWMVWLGCSAFLIFTYCLCKKVRIFVIHTKGRISWCIMIMCCYLDNAQIPIYKYDSIYLECRKTCFSTFSDLYKSLTTRCKKEDQIAFEKKRCRWGNQSPTHTLKE